MSGARARRRNRRIARFGGAPPALRYCRNPECAEVLDVDRLAELCPSCDWIGRRRFAAGSFVGGLLAGGLAWLVR